jgi:hypothetical protein
LLPCCSVGASVNVTCPVVATEVLVPVEVWVICWPALIVTMVVVNSRRVVDRRSEVLVIGAVLLVEEGGWVVAGAFAVERAGEEGALLLSLLLLLSLPAVGVGVGVFAGESFDGGWDGGGLFSDGEG